MCRWSIVKPIAAVRFRPALAFHWRRERCVWRKSLAGCQGRNSQLARDRRVITDSDKSSTRSHEVPRDRVVGWERRGVEIDVASERRRREPDDDHFSCRIDVDRLPVNAARREGAMVVMRNPPHVAVAPSRQCLVPGRREEGPVAALADIVDESGRDAESECRRCGSPPATLPMSSMRHGR